MDRPALFLTAYNRPQYLAPTLDSWHDVRGLSRWRVMFSVEPSPVQDEIVRMIGLFCESAGIEPEIVLNHEVYGVLHHPWVGFEKLFTEGHPFVVRAEDDLLVSSDTLEYFEWCAREYGERSDVAAIHSHSGHPLNDDQQEQVEVSNWFSPLLWGTWADRWTEYIRDTWDHDYSTFNGQPGHQSGWDWNLNTRVLPRLAKKCAHPIQARTDHIGVHGTHGTAENFRPAASFRRHRPPVKYWSVN